MQDESPQQKLDERGLGDILNETFTIYGRRFTKLVTLVAVVQVPLSVMTLLLALIFSNDPVASIVLVAIAVGAGMISYGALIFAVGQHYVQDSVSVGRCYTRVLWRVVSMSVLATLLAVLLVLTLAPTMFAPGDGPSPLALLTLAIAFVLLVYLLYLTFATPAVIVEGYRSFAALRRGFNLARGSELRILGHLLVYGLVGLGLIIVIGMPFQLVTVLAFGEEVSIPGQIAETIGLLVAGVLVPPVTVIATTLLYYDLRVRKEGYNMSRLTIEMGGAAA